MKSSNPLERFKKKIIIESILNSLLYGAIIGGSFSLLLICVLALFGVKITWLSIVFAIVFISGATLFSYFKFFNPNEKLLAAKVDTLGLENRASTMIENKDNDSLMAKLQREDAEDKITKTDVKTYHIRLQLKPLVASTVVILALFLCITLIPERHITPTDGTNTSSEIIDSSSEEPIDDQKDKEDEIIDALINQLIEIVDEAKVSDELKMQLYEIIENLRIKLEDVDNLQTKIDLINEAREEILKLIEEYLEEYDIGHGMLKYDITSLLGKAIIDKDLDGVDAAIDLMEAYIRAHPDVQEEIDKLYEVIKTILSKATKEENEALIEAVTNFRSNLRYGDESTLEATMNQAAEEIKNALLTEIMDPQESEEQQELEDLETDIDSAIQDALDQLEDQQQQDQQQDQGSDEADSDDQEEANRPPKISDDPLDSEPVIDGNTPYLSIFEEYYEKIMEAIANNEEITDEERAFIEMYLNMLR